MPEVYVRQEIGEAVKALIADARMQALKRMSEDVLRECVIRDTDGALFARNAILTVTLYQLISEARDLGVTHLGYGKFNPEASAHDQVFLSASLDELTKLLEDSALIRFAAQLSKMAGEI